MCTDYVEEKRELIQAILKHRKLSDLPRITQVQAAVVVKLFDNKLFNIKVTTHFPKLFTSL